MVIEAINEAEESQVNQAYLNANGPPRETSYAIDNRAPPEQSKVAKALDSVARFMDTGFSSTRMVPSSITKPKMESPRGRAMEWNSWS
jgi:hypothetical protein